MILPGSITVEITAADCARLLRDATDRGIVLKRINICNDLTFRTTLQRRDYRQLCMITDKLDATVKVLNISGAFLVLRNLVHRPVLMVFATVIFLFTCFVPGRIYFISVEGNTTVPDNYILDIAAECGIGFGAKRRAVRSEKIKNQLLEKIPQLQWTGINTSGCTAVISVREKTAADIRVESKNQVSGIVAARDGIIQSCTVLQGNALCRIGQAVKAGQLLVSGYLDCGIITKTTQAKAEIYALTNRDLTVVAMEPTATRGDIAETKTRYSLKIGKNLIKFKNYSGNLDTGCGKIYTEEYMCLPGGFYLPVALVKETEIYYQTGTSVETETDQWVTEAAKAYLKGIMISGRIVSEDFYTDIQPDIICLHGKFACIEMIGQTKYEQTLPKDEDI